MAAVIFNGDQVKTLKDKLQLGNDPSSPQIINTDIDPSITGLPANINSIAISSATGHMYKKYGSVSTEWIQLSTEVDVNNYISPMITNLNGWSRYDDGAVAAPLTGDGIGSPSISVLFLSGILLTASGVGSMEVNNNSGNVQGQGTSKDFSIYPIDKNKKLNFKLDYLSLGLEAGHYAVYVYDIDNATMLGRVVNDDSGEIPSIPSLDFGSMNASFYATDSVNYRLIIHSTSTSTATNYIVVSGFEVSSDEAVPGYIGSKPVDFTPSFSFLTIGNGVLNYSKWWRVGNMMHGRISLTWGTTTSISGTNPLSSVRFVVPDGESIDLPLFQDHATGGGQFVVAGAKYMAALNNYDPTAIEINAFYTNLVSNGIEQRSLTATVPGVWSTGAVMDINFSVPIEGWETTRLISSLEKVYSTVKVLVNNNANTVLTANVTDIDFSSTDKDSHGAWDGTKFTAPKSSWYDVDGFIRCAAGASQVYSGWVDGVGGKAISTPGPGDWVNISAFVYLQKGEAYSLRCNQAKTLVSSSTVHWLKITSVEDFSIFGEYSNRKIISSQSSEYQPVSSGVWAAFTGNDLDLTPGIWELKPSLLKFWRSGVCNYTRTKGAWQSSAGNGTGSTPSDLVNAAGLTIITETQNGEYDFGGLTDYALKHSGSIFVLVTQPVTVYLNMHFTAGTAGNVRLTAFPTAERIE